MTKVTDRKHDANIHAQQSNAQESRHTNAEIELVNNENMVHFFIFDQTKHGGHDNGGKGYERSVAEKRS